MIQGIGYFLFILFKQQTTSGQVGFLLLVHRVATTEVFGDTSATRVGCTPHRHRRGCRFN